jgi:type IV secretory pathway TrbL component
MKDQYTMLSNERENIQKILQEQTKIGLDNKNMELYNAQNKTYYTLWAYLAFVFIIIFIKMVIYPEMNVNWGSFVLYTIIGAILLMLVHFLKSVNIFYIFLLIIISAGIIISFFS